MMTARKLHKHMHVDLRAGSMERVLRHHRARRGPEARRAMLALVRRGA
jgi:hypothetical protein